MADSMMFPREWEKFIEDYSFTDSEEVYTNGSELVPVFRVEQMIEHYFDNTSIHVADIPAVPGPSEDDPNIMELCFRNGKEEGRKELKAEVMAHLLDQKTKVKGLCHSHVVELMKFVEGL